MTLPGAISPPLSTGARRPIQGRAEACFSAVTPALTNLGHDTPRSLLALSLFDPSVSRLEPRGEGRSVLFPGRAGAAPGGRRAPGAKGRWALGGAGAGRGAADSLSRALCNLTFSSLDAFNSWINCTLDLAGWEGSPPGCKLDGAVIWPTHELSL